MRIPLPKLMRHWREREFERHLSPATVRTGLALLGLLRDAAAALRGRDVARRLRARPRRPAPRPLPLAAARRRLDAASRLPGARGADLPGAVEAAGADAMSARDTVLASIRRSLGVTRRRAARAAPRSRSGSTQHPRGVIPARGQLPPPERVEAVRRRWSRPRPARSRDPARRRRRPGRRRGASARGITCRCRSAAATIRASPRCRGSSERTLEVSTGASDGHQLASV